MSNLPTEPDALASVIRRVLREEFNPQIAAVHDRLNDQDAFLKRTLRPPRTRPSAETMRQMLATLKTYDSVCPSCLDELVFDDDGRLIGELDHATGNPSNCLPHQVWIICRPCNTGFHVGRISRLEREPAFNEFQRRRRWLAAGRQMAFYFRAGDDDDGGTPPPLRLIQ
jgi:hypothetical protein